MERNVPDIINLVYINSNFTFVSEAIKNLVKPYIPLVNKIN